MTEGDTINRKYPFGKNGTEVQAGGNLSRPENGFINIDGAKIIWLTGTYIGNASSVTITVYGHADEDDNADPIATMTLDSSLKHAKIQVPIGLPFATIGVTNNDLVNPATFTAIVNIVR